MQNKKIEKKMFRNKIIDKNCLGTYIASTSSIVSSFWLQIIPVNVLKNEENVPQQNFVICNVLLIKRQQRFLFFVCFPMI